MLLLLFFFEVGGVVPRYFPLFVLSFYDGKHKKKTETFFV